MSDVQVRPLEWEESEGNYPGLRVWSYDDMQSMWIVKNPDTLFLWCQTITMEFAPASPVMGEFDTLEAAQEAAQAYHEQRIRNFLVTP